LASVEQKYWLSAHVHACVTDDYAVLLDLRRDKYMGIAREHLAALAATVHGWPEPGRYEATPPTSSANALVRQLVASGVLTMDPAMGKDVRSPVIAPPRFEAVEPDLEYRPRITLRNVSRLSIAAAKAQALLKLRPIEAVVTRVRERKQRENPAGEFDLAAARPLIAEFLYLRPLVFTSRDECLFDSLVLVELLARQRLFPDWLFGVSTNPFKAHSWVQAGDHVLNDLPERIAKFTPILVV
jgi:hypothetical protein